MQILVHRHLFHVIDILHLVISRWQVIGESVVAARNVHHRSPVARHNFTLRRGALQIRERRYFPIARVSLYLSVTVVHAGSRIRQIVPEIRADERMLSGLYLSVQAGLSSQIGGDLRLEFRTDTRVHPRVVRRPEFGAQSYFVHSEVRLQRDADLWPDVGPVGRIVGFLNMRLAVLDQHRHVDLLQRLVLHALRLEFLRVLQPRAFVLVPSVLEPDLHLGAGQL